MKHISNKQKAEQISQNHKNFYYLESGTPTTSALECYHSAMEMAQWKDKERKELWRITRNHYQEWAIEQLTAFAQHLNKRGAFRDDLCMDFEHEAQSFIEMQNNKEL